MKQPRPNSSLNGLDFLANRKQQLKHQIEQQKEKLQISTDKLFSLDYVVRAAIGKVTSRMSVIDGVLFGYRLFRHIKKFFHSKD